jgi:hypothetical protein
MIDLLHIMKDVPKTTIKKVRNWALEHSKVINDVDNPLPTPDAVIDDGLKRFDLTGLIPKTKLVLLVHAQIKTNVVLHSVKDAIYSLLRDPRLQHDDVFLFWGDDPFGKPVLSDYVDKCVDNAFFEISDINTGSRYWECHAKLCTEDGHVLCPLIFSSTRPISTLKADSA